MEKVEIRVRPVIRHIVTRYTEGGSGGEGASRASLETLGEFDNEAQADEVAKCVAEVHLAHLARARADEHPQPMQYAAVERSWDWLTNVQYFGCREEVDEFVSRALAAGREFRVFSREITDLVALAHHEMSGGRSAAVSELPPPLREPAAET